MASGCLTTNHSDIQKLQQQQQQQQQQQRTGASKLGEKLQRAQIDLTKIFAAVYGTSKAFLLNVYESSLEDIRHKAGNLNDNQPNIDHTSDASEAKDTDDNNNDINSDIGIDIDIENNSESNNFCNRIARSGEFLRKSAIPLSIAMADNRMRRSCGRKGDKDRLAALSAFLYYHLPRPKHQGLKVHAEPSERTSARFANMLHVYMLAIMLITTAASLPSASANGLLKHEPMFISRSETFKFVAGETIVLPCEVANTDPYVVAWKRGIAILTAGSVKVTPDPRVRLVNGFNLQIRDAVPQDAGDYICQIATMEPREITHTVEILVPPRIHHISTGGHLQVKKGSSVRIECSASGNPTPNVTWSRKNNILPNGEEKLHSHVLSIENVDRHKGGVYICTANNGVGQAASSQVVLHVLYPPEISVERPVVFSGEGHEAMLVCIVHGETQPEVIWFKDTMQLDTTERHIMENRGSRHTLIIRKVHPQDFGNYSCVAENQLGKSRKTLQLSGKPNVAVFNSPPISQYKDKYNISWTVDSHTPIEEYKLSFRKLPQGHDVVDNAIDSAQHSSSSSVSLSSSMQMYGGGGSGIGTHNHRISGIGSIGGMGSSSSSSSSSSGNYGGYGNLMHWGRNDWRDVVLPAIPTSHHYTQGMSYMIRGLDPDHHYEATVQARNRYGWSEMTHSFIFSTSSNDGLVDLSTLLNHGQSDNEMRDLSVTFYGGNGAVTNGKHSLGYIMMNCFALWLVKITQIILTSAY